MVVKKSHVAKLIKYVGFFIFITSCLACVVSGGFLVDRLITLGLGLEVIILGPIFFFSSLIVSVSSLNLNVFGISKKIKGYVVWSALMAAIFTFVLAYNLLRNTPKDLFIAEYYWEAGIKLFLRKNGTYKTINTNWVSSHIGYGKYKIQDNNIIITRLVAS